MLFAALFIVRHMIFSRDEVIPHTHLCCTPNTVFFPFLPLKMVSGSRAAEAFSMNMLAISLRKTMILDGVL